MLSMEKNAPSGPTRRGFELLTIPLMFIAYHLVFPLLEHVSFASIASLSCLFAGLAFFFLRGVRQTFLKVSLKQIMVLAVCAVVFSLRLVCMLSALRILSPVRYSLLMQPDLLKSLVDAIFRRKRLQINHSAVGLAVLSLVLVGLSGSDEDDHHTMIGGSLLALISTLLDELVLFMLQRTSRMKGSPCSQRNCGVMWLLSAAVFLPFVLFEMAFSGEQEEGPHGAGSSSFLFRLGFFAVGCLLYPALVLLQQNSGSKKPARKTFSPKLKIGVVCASLTVLWGGTAAREGDRLLVLLCGAAAAVAARWIAMQESPSAPAFGKLSALQLSWTKTSRALGPRKLISDLKKVLRVLLEDRNSKRILFFLSINFAFMFVEIVVGVWTNSLGLISDAGHMFFDNASLFLGLAASYVAKWKPDDVASYGYQRCEVLAGFANGVFLVFVALMVVLEALHRVAHPPHVHDQHLILVSVMGLLVNLVGLAFFHDAHSHCHHDHPAPCSHDHDHGHECSHHHHQEAPKPRVETDGHNENMRGLFLHVLADTLGSVGCIVSSICIKLWGWHIADPIASLMISVLIFLSVMPLLAGTVETLVGRCPRQLQRNLEDACERIQHLEGVLRVERPHFWQNSSEMVVGTLKVLVLESVSSAQHQQLLKQSTALLRGAGCTESTVEITKSKLLQ